MYESFFGLTDRPFPASPHSDRYYPAPAIEQARQTLARVIERAEGTGIVIGPAGCGKTILCQVIAEMFRDKMLVANLCSGRLTTRRALLQAILYELGQPYRGAEEGELRLSLVEHVAGQSAKTAGALPGLLLIVDEAHTLPLALLEELRLITNLGRACVRLILMGGASLEERLASPRLEAFNQRVAARCYLEPLDRAHTIEYARHQIETAGGLGDAIFSADALEAVFHATGGIPRLINQVCDHALVLAYAGGVTTLKAPGIEEAWADLQQLPTPWTSSSTISADAGAVIEFGALDDTGREGPAAVPFRTAQGESRSVSSDSVRRLEQIQRQLDELDSDFQPAGTIAPEVEIDFSQPLDPFHEIFEEEEVVIDRYTASPEDPLTNRPLVHSSESQGLAALLSVAALSAPAAQPIVEPQRPSLAIAAATWPGGTLTSDRPVAQAVTTFAPPSAQERADEPIDVIETWTPFAEVVAPPTHSFDLQKPAAEQADGLDLIVIEEPQEHVLASSNAPPARAQRREYRQLFAQLRSG
jgi:type II secretory pathway predicted ATPase ExeA